MILCELFPEIQVVLTRRYCQVCSARQAKAVSCSLHLLVVRLG